MQIGNRFAVIALFGLFGSLVAAGCGSDGTVNGATNVTPPPPVVVVAGDLNEVTPPIVLMHGMAGFSEIGGLEYFNGIPEALRADGYQVFVTTVDPFQSVEVRAGQAAQQIDAILAQTGAKKVHLIGHSQGGLDARYVVSGLGYGDRVASVTTVATPHHGSKVSDLALGLIPGDAFAATAALTSVLLGNVTGTPADIGTQLHELSSTYCDQTFNPSNPNDPRVKYYSVAGKTQPWLTVDVNTTDIVDPLFLSSYWIVDGLEGDNDGLVSVASGTWGAFLGTVPADHLDEIGLPGTAFHPAYDQVAFFRKLVKFIYGGPAPI